MYKLFIISTIIMAILAVNIYSSAKKTIKNVQEKRQKIYAELGINF